MRWYQLQQLGAEPGPRSSHAICAVGDYVYMFGGELQPRVPVDALLFQYNLPSQTWQKLETKGTAPGPRVAATMAAVADKIYLFGGRTGTNMGEGAQADLFIFDTTTLTWSPVLPSSPPAQQQQQNEQGRYRQGSGEAAAAAAAAPPPRSYHAMTAAGGRLYVFGGCGASGRLSDLWCFDPVNKSWSQLPTCPTLGPRGGAVMVAAPDGTKLYILGGFNGAELADWHEFDIAGSCWHCHSTCQHTTPAAGGESSNSTSSSQTMPVGRSVFGAAAHGGCHTSSTAAAGSCCAAHCSHCCHIVMFGGEVSPSDKGHTGAGNFTAATYCLAPSAGTSAAAAAAGTTATAVPSWHVLEVGGEAPGPRGWFAATGVAGGDLLLHGGLGASNERLGDMFRLAMH